MKLQDFAQMKDWWKRLDEAIDRQVNLGTGGSMDPSQIFHHATVDSSGCWIWRKAKTTAGYGSFTHEGERYYTHRMAWEQWHNRVVPDGMCVMHSCDNPPCINPHHLILGTKDDNSKDMIRKGRSNSGERNPMSKLNTEVVLEIRKLYADGVKQEELARRYGVRQQAISRIVNKQRWPKVG